MAAALSNMSYLLSASGCPHANRNKARTMESTFSMSPGVFKYSSHIKPSFGTGSLTGTSGSLRSEKAGC